MGGYGSGPAGWNAKTTVEDCISLKVEKLFRDKLIGVRTGGGTLVWKDPISDESTTLVGYKVDTDFENWITLTLEYTVTSQAGDKTKVKEPIHLSFTRPNYGGKRWWFHCPLILSGKPCQRRVGKLYLPPGGRYFGCRQLL